MSILAEAEAVVEEATDARCPLPLLLTPAGWEPWSPPSTHPAAARYERMRVRYEMKIYAEQKDLLATLFRQTGSDVFPATYSAWQDKTGRQHTMCVWSRNVLNLLPRTDTIVFVDTSRPKGQETLGMFTWESVQAAVGGSLQPTSMYPERWLADFFPDSQALSRFQPA